MRVLLFRDLEPVAVVRARGPDAAWQVEHDETDGGRALTYVLGALQPGEEPRGAQLLEHAADRLHGFVHAEVASNGVLAHRHALHRWGLQPEPEEEPA